MAKKNSKDKPLFVLVDSNALVHRAYHAYPPTLTLPDGTQINAVYGFTSLLLDILKKFKPDYVICAFDSPKPTIRHTEYVGYKATRKKTDSELKNQFPIVYEVVNALNIPLHKVDGFEADDIIGTFAKRDYGIDVEKIIVTGDHDLLQLVNGDVKVYMAGSAFSKSKLYDTAAVNERYGFDPIHIIDYKALRGDTSDNIPGVPGIGEKGATTLINKYGTIENIYASIEEVEPKLQKKLIDGHDSAILSKKLATIMTDAPLSFKLKEGELRDFDRQEVAELFQRLQFRSLIGKIPESSRTVIQAATDQSNFFDLNAVATTTPTKLSSSETLKELNEIHDSGEFVFEIIGDESIVGMAFASNKKSIFLNGTQLKDNEIKGKLKKLLSSQSTKITYSSKHAMHKLRTIGLELSKPYEDVMIQAYLLLEGERIQGAKALAFSVLGDVLPEDTEILGTGKSKITWEKVSENLLEGYGKRVSQAVFNLYKTFSEQLSKPANKKLKALYEDVERPLTQVLFEMEKNGVSIDTEYLINLKSELEKESEKIKKEVFHDIGHEFNLSSPKQLGEVLFGELALPGARKSKNGSYSTNERVLRDIMDAHPAIAKILEFRELEKLKSTYTDALIIKVDPETHRIHGDFNQAGASSGRLSSKDPNLQNIPISSENGLRIRKTFTAPAKRMLLALDVSQQELRVAANLSHEDKLIEAFQKGEDVHVLTASQMFNIKPEEVTKAQRSVGKTMNFSLLYGISTFGLADRLKISRDEAKGLIDRFWDSYPKIRKYFDELLESGRKVGYCETYFGRRRSAKNLLSNNFQLRSAAERELMNFPIQGTSADLIKMSMIELQEAISKDNPLNALMMLQVHDELVLEIDEVSEEKVVSFAKKLVNIMEGVEEFEVPIKVEAKLGKNWAEMNNIKL